jgi:hypothetical protein
MATFTSPDGINWTAQHIPGSGSNVGSWAKPYFIGGTSYIVPGVSTYALSTNNGSTWTSYSYPSVITANSSNNFAYNGSNLVMLAAETAVYTSPDGINWTAVTCPYTILMFIMLVVHLLLYQVLVLGIQQITVQLGHKQTFLFLQVHLPHSVIFWLLAVILLVLP